MITLIFLLLSSCSEKTNKCNESDNILNEVENTEIIDESIALLKKSPGVTKNINLSANETLYKVKIDRNSLDDIAAIRTNNLVSEIYSKSSELFKIFDKFFENEQLKDFVFSRYIRFINFLSFKEFIESREVEFTNFIKHSKKEIDRVFTTDSKKEYQFSLLNYLENLFKMEEFKKNDFFSIYNEVKKQLNIEKKEDLKILLKYMSKEYIYI